MSYKYDLHTYRAGKKVNLRKSDNELVVRKKPGEISPQAAYQSFEQVSSASTLIKTTKELLEQTMTQVRAEAPTHHAYYEKEADSIFPITDRIFCTFKSTPSDDVLSTFIAKYALVLLKRYGETDFLFQLTNQTGINPVKLVVKLTEDEDLVAHAEHDLNHQIHTYQVALPIDPAYIQEWHLHTNFNHIDYNQSACTRCEDAWQLLDGYGSDSIAIAISDDGCRLDHSDFNSSNKFTGWGYFRGQRLITNNDFDSVQSEMYKPGANHGTSCAGVTAGEIDATRIVGAAPGCRLLPIQWESSGLNLFISSSRMLTALDYIADKADIMSNSWGNVPINVWPTIVVNRITQLAQTGGPRGKGILFLWAAGNENCPINLTANQDIPYTSGTQWQGNVPVWVGVQTARTFENNLVNIPGLMHVAACASNAKRSHYSNYGPGINISSPSSNSHTYGRMVVRGLGITTATGESTGVTDSFGGTSSATPLVAGIAALVVSANPDLTAEEVASILMQTAWKGLDMLEYPKTEPATFDLDTSWDISPVVPFANGDFADNGSPDGSWSPWYGHGRVDAHAAVAEALNRKIAIGEKHFSENATPNLSIPDNNTTGITDTINCGKSFAVEAVSVRVDITHTFSGDLQIGLQSPSGATVTLHNRTGGSTHDIHEDFDSQNTPELLNLRNEDSLGVWQLVVKDLAAADAGRLQSWSIQLRGSNTEEVVVSESPGLIIPDSQAPGIERTLNIGRMINISWFSVFVDITHTYIGDLAVRLIAPDGTVVNLFERTGGPENNLIRDYSMSNTPALQSLLGRDSQGDWQLQVVDHATADQGKLNFWQITVS